MSDMVIPLLLLLGGVLFFLLELFLPSGGVLGLMALSVVGVAIWKSFEVSEQVGMIFVLVVIVVLPLAVVLGLTIMPKTPLVKRMILRNRTEKPNESVSGRAGVDSLNLEELVGAVGKAASDLRPAGTAIFHGKRYGVTARDFISAGRSIVVSEVEGNTLIVSLSDDEQEA